MSGRPQTGTSEEGARNYTFLGLTALVVLLLALVARGLGTWSLLPVLLGLASLLGRWRGGSVVLVLAVTVLLFGSSLMRTSLRPDLPLIATPVSDLLLTAAVLGYVAAHYRLIGLTRFVFPRDPRRGAEPPRRPGEPVPRGRRPGLMVPQRRSPETATPAELGLLLASLPLFCGLALLGQKWLVPGRPSLNAFRDQANSGAYYEHEIFLMNAGQALVDALWQGRPLLWWVGGGVLFAWAVLSYLGWRRMRSAEAALVLQDTVWAETRGEQRRINSWLVWVRLRRGPREGRS
jgi:hypothetical protein